MNDAVTLVAWVRVTVQRSVPAHAPPQPAKMAPVAGMAVNVTLVPLVKETRQVLPQLMPLGEEPTVPLALPTFLTVRVAVVWVLAVVVFAAKVAVTLRAVVMLTVHGLLVPVQAPVQPVKVEPVNAAALRVTEVPEA